MPLDRFVLIIICVIIAAAVTVWLATLVAASVQMPVFSVAAVPLLLVGYVVWRVISERLSSKEDDHYDDIEK